LCQDASVDGYLKVVFSDSTDIYIGFGHLCDDMGLSGFVPSESPFIKNIMRPTGELYRHYFLSTCCTFRSILSFHRKGQFMGLVQFDATVPSLSATPTSSTAIADVWRVEKVAHGRSGCENGAEAPRCFRVRRGVLYYSNSWKFIRPFTRTP
jgi:hypothetical protein